MGISCSSTRLPKEEDEFRESQVHPDLRIPTNLAGNPLFSIYKSTKFMLQKVWFVFNFWRRTADPHLPVQNPASPLLVPLSNADSISIGVNDEAETHSCLVSWCQNPASGLSAALSDAAAEDSVLTHSSCLVSWCSDPVGEPTLLVPASTLSDASSSSADSNDEETLFCLVSYCQEMKEEENNYEDEKEVDDDAVAEGAGSSVALIKSSSVFVVREERWIKQYSSSHKILLVGEGDFSFSACLAVAFGSAANIIATSLNSKAFLKSNYGNALSNLKKLRDRGSRVMHGIDATGMANHEFLGRLKFDRIIFNFPFAGFFHGLSTKCQLRRHRRLVSQFMKNAREMMSESGEIHISHKTNGNFHAAFKLETIAASHRLRLVEATQFERGEYPGYNTKYGFGGDDNFNCNPSKTFKFAL